MHRNHGYDSMSALCVHWVKQGIITLCAVATLLYLVYSQTAIYSLDWDLQFQGWIFTFSGTSQAGW